VYKLARKPTLKEFRMITRVSALGLVVIGVIGYVIQLIFHFLVTPFFTSSGILSSTSIPLIELIRLILLLL